MFPLKYGNRAFLTPFSLQSKQLQPDYVSSHKIKKIATKALRKDVIDKLQ